MSGNPALSIPMRFEKKRKKSTNKQRGKVKVGCHEIIQKDFLFSYSGGVRGKFGKWV